MAQKHAPVGSCRQTRPGAALAAIVKTPSGTAQTAVENIRPGAALAAVGKTPYSTAQTAVEIYVQVKHKLLQVGQLPEQ